MVGSWYFCLRDWTKIVLLRRRSQKAASPITVIPDIQLSVYYCIRRRETVSTPSREINSLSLAVEITHVRVAVAGCAVCGNGGFDPRQIKGVELYVGGLQRVLKLEHPAGADKGNDVFTPGQHPGDGQLGDCSLLLAGDDAQSFDKSQVFSRGFRSGNGGRNFANH